MGLSRPTHGPMQLQQLMSGMPPGPLPFPNQSMAMGQTDPSQIDANHIPPYSLSSAVIQHETHMDNHTNPPPVCFSCYLCIPSNFLLNSSILFRPSITVQASNLTSLDLSDNTYLFTHDIISFI